MRRPALAVVCLLLLVPAPGQTLAGSFLFQFQGAFGAHEAPARLYLFVNPDRIDPSADGPDEPSLSSGSHHNLMGLPLYQRGQPLPDVVYQAASTRARRGQGNLARLCRDNLLACAAGGVRLLGPRLGPTSSRPSQAFGPKRLAP